MNEIFKAIELPGQEFKTKAEMHLALKTNADKIIGIKKAQVHKSAEKGQLFSLNAPMKTSTIKAGIEAKEGFIYPIISTTRYLDSHKDCHFDGCFTKTVKDQQGKIHYALDHEIKFDSIIAWPKDITMSVQSIDWSVVGKDYVGKTEALVFEINKDKIVRKDVLQAIESKVADFENSIRMVYHKIVLGIDSTEKGFEAEKKYYDERIGSISNKEEVEKDAYFWGVEELQIYKEGSLVVAGGSNDATSIFSKDLSEPSKDTLEIKEEQSEPLANTLDEEEQKRKLLLMQNS